MNLNGDISFAKSETAYYLPILPGFHSCQCRTMESIITKHRLKPAKCPVFEKEMIYLFYGSPAYRDKKDSNSHITNYIFSPCCFIFDLEKLDMPMHAYPFDTGAFNKGLYREHIPEDCLIEEFSLDMSEGYQKIHDYISALFSDNRIYLSGVCQRSTNDSLGTALMMLVSLFTASGHVLFDNRSHTIELIFESSIELKNACKAVIIPESFKRNPYFSDFCKAFPNVAVHSYEEDYPSLPTEHYGALNNVYKEYIKSQKIDTNGNKEAMVCE